MKRPRVDKSVLTISGESRFEDDAYRKFLRGERCIITGQFGTDADAVDPLHVGTLGKGVKSHDYWMLPVLHSLHQEGHQKGEISMFRKHLPDDVLRAALRAYAKERYEEWKAAQPIKRAS